LFAEVLPPEEDVVIYIIPSLGVIAVFSWLAVASWSDARRREREAYYRSETLKKIAEAQGTGAAAAIEMMREDERRAARRRQESHRLGGLISIGVGLGMGIFLWAMELDKPAYLVGLIPGFVGVALLLYSYVLAPKE
jgi:uncharacterized membrane protein